jgi:FAD/FMN-containing dehydrogenase/Fe-S oxidoreductase
MPSTVPDRRQADALAAELRRVLRGETRFDEGSRALYATDASNYRQVPIGVVLPADTDDVLETLRLCRKYEAPVLARGGGTSLAGQCCNVAVVIDMSKYMNRVLAIDAGARLARVQAGTVLDTLQAAARTHHLVFGPDPATHTHCTLGGMIGNNSCGVHSVMSQFYGPGVRTSDNIEELEIVTYDGERMRVGRTSDAELDRVIREGGRRGAIFEQLKSLADKYAALIRGRFPDIPRRVSGYNLTELLPENGFNVAGALAGSEGTCVFILEAVARLIALPSARAVVVLGYPDVFEAADHVVEIMQFKPIGLEGMDDRLVTDLEHIVSSKETLKVLPEGRGWLIVEFGGTSKADADRQAQALMTALSRTSRPPAMKLFDDAEQEHKVWKVRESGLGATAHVTGQKPTWEGWEDSAVPPERLGRYLRDLRRLLDEHHYIGDFYGHFGQGCLHTRIDFDLESADGVAKFRAFLEEAADLVLSHGGSLSGEHGDGQSRAELLPKMFGKELMQAFREFKSIWDPGWKMNPGKIVEPFRLDENLRLGPSYKPLELRTHFPFAAEGGSFAKATLRCVGVGECRKLEHDTMCPSYMATREEKHSTRGRARLLYEMLRRDSIGEPGHNHDVKDALDLCLACKGCKHECPVQVDMATYKAEFLAHYYEGRLRPRSAYAFGLIHWWTRFARSMPRVVNFVTHAPGLARAAKIAGGMAPEREFPRFAPQTFTAWFHRRRARAAHAGAPPVLLWPDTFNDHFHPDTLVAAVDVLESAGYAVELPRPNLCCGRPLYDYGMLDLAKHQLNVILEALLPRVREGAPIVGLEPSCIAVFRDELRSLFPSSDDARLLSEQSFLIGEFIARERGRFQIPKRTGKALVHVHCHHNAVVGFDAERSLLQQTGLDVNVVDSGCCGMAGSFGFEEDKYEISMKIGERVLLPAVRSADADTLIIADGFSCREQIVQSTHRRALHLVEVLRPAPDNSMEP